MKIVLTAALVLSAFAAEPYVDRQSGLMWQDDSATAEAKMTWHEGMQYCGDLRIGHHEDWRLPTVQELFTLVDFGRREPAAIKAIRHVRSEDYWTSTTDLSDTDDAWLVFFENGAVDNYAKTRKRHIRCVRNLTPVETGETPAPAAK